MRFDWAKRAIGLKSLTTLKKQGKPACGGKFIVVNESDEFTRCLLQGAIAAEGDILLRFIAVNYRYSRATFEFRDGLASRFRGIIVGDHDGVTKLAIRLLRFQRIQETFQQHGAFESADADGDMRLLTCHDRILIKLP
jgi:hypothetical protein